VIAKIFEPKLKAVAGVWKENCIKNCFVIFIFRRLSTQLS